MLPCSVEVVKYTGDMHCSLYFYVECATKLENGYNFECGGISIL
jgi:hypothetical protein